MDNIKLPTRQELVDYMLKGTTMWWELVDDNWVHYFADCKDVYDNTFTNRSKVALVKVFNRVLLYKEKAAIFQKEGRLFAKKDGKIIELKEWGNDNARLSCL